MKKFVLTLDLVDNKEKRKALKIVAALPGVDEISMDMTGKKLTVIGTVDPVSVVSKLRKFWHTAGIVSVGPAKVEAEKKEEPEKEEAKKEEAKKEDGKKEETKKKEGKKEEAPKEEANKKEEGKEEEKKAGPVVVQPQLQMQIPLQHQMLPLPPPHQQPMVGMVMPYRSYYPPMHTYAPYYPQPNNAYYQVRHHSVEENPNSCAIS